MREYGIMILAAAGVVCICSLLSYKGKSSGTVRLALSVLLVYCLLSPVMELLSGGVDLPIIDTEFDPEDYGEDYALVTRDAVCRGIEAAVCAEFSLKDGDVRAFIKGFEFESFTAESVVITLSGSAVFADRKKIEGYVNELGLGRCDVEIEIG